ncbi:hypothetical protein COU17_03245 [Candidatus Kaiserbacteria bacterium CG10_big_fil_rev_8_21_14_0_10_49_17]|uniref:Glycosyltransferase family 1 protein n=1 Tax=Candidatus Kaiserbacteria bacterium CG10_big_fil_rev_8_21_14_0_10_49_17 TaxID=1974609 RepID=A0A2M6WDX3_9BACT|nr:MAG: hypothetical protein COU17_03245 [Candidatus Kaiserbacteria bacterium CG10_big_fil_rev_8_21_14_0_10_49_17]
MKIVYAITKSNFGGAQRYVFDLATALREAGQDVVVLGGAGDALPVQLKKHGIRFRRIPHMDRDVRITSDVRAFFALMRLIREERPDILHLNSSKMGIMGAVASLFAGNPKTFFTIHGWAFTEDRPAYQRFPIKALQWLTVMLSSRSIAVSKKVAKELSKHPKITYIPNGITPPEFLSKKDARTAIAKYVGTELPESAFVFGTIAELHKNKNLGSAIRALPENSFFIVIGDGEERQSLQRLIESLSLRNRVFLAGRIKNAATLLAAFDVFLLPSKKEGLPYVLLEAGMAQVPVVATPVGGIPELIEHDVTGLLATPAVFSDALLRISKDAELRMRLGEALRRKVSSYYTLKRMVEATANLYATVQ